MILGRSVTSLASATWSPNKTGHYNLYVRAPAASHFASNTPFTIQHSAGNTKVRLNQQIHSGEWVYLGNFNLKNSCHSSGRCHRSSRCAFITPSSYAFTQYYPTILSTY